MSENQPRSDVPAEVEMSVDEVLAYALKLQQEGRVEGAAQLYTRILEQVPDHVDALNFLGVAKFQLGDGQAAVELISRAIKLKPDFAGAYNNFGNVLSRLDRPAEAAQAYERVIQLEPNSVDAQNNLGALLRATGKVAEAEPVLRRALELAPDNADVLHNLGNVLAELERFHEAADVFARAMELRPYDGKSYLRLGTGLYGLKREQDALKVYQRWVEVEPDSVEARHMLAAATRQAVPSRASDAYVQQSFDRFAARFDAQLTKLDYRAPRLLADLAAKILGPRQSRLEVLDAGCGTGLCGALFKAWASRLVGVDLSPKMIEKARLREIYDDLILDELTAYLTAHPTAYDLVISADTLCYFGDLTIILPAAADSLRRPGYLGFTVEKAEHLDSPDGYAIGFHGRYSHNEWYVLRVLSQAGLDPVSVVEATLRRERDEPVRGFVIMAAKTA